MKTPLALFDFDHTLYRGDSMLDFTKFAFGGTRFYTGMALISPILILMKLGIISHESAKIAYQRYFFAGKSEQDCKEKAKDFSLKIGNNLDDGLSQKLKQHRASGHHIYIVSASCTLWLRDWCSLNGVGLIANEMESVNGQLTGRLVTKNCRGPEKVERIREHIDVDSYSEVYVCGKGRGDREMLQLHRPPENCFTEIHEQSGEI